MQKVQPRRLGVDQVFSEADAAAREALESLQRMQHVTANFWQIVSRAARKLEPEVRAQLDISYARTGLGKKTGNLYAAWVTESIIKSSLRGILVYIAPNLPDEFYRYAAVFQAGGVWGIKSAPKDSKAIRFRRNLKASQHGYTTKLGGGIRTQAARPIEFSNEQMADLSERFIELINAELAGEANQL